MLVDLDGYFNPKRIIEAFLLALPTTKYYDWVYENIHSQCTEEGKITNCIGIRAHYVQKFRRFLIFGDEVLKEGHLHFNLTPIPDAYPQCEVEIIPLLEYQLNKEGSVTYTCEDPDSPSFKKALPIWNSFLSAFKQELMDLS